MSCSYRLSYHELDLISWMTMILDSCRDAGDAVPLFIQLGKLFEGANREEINKKVSDLLLEKEMYRIPCPQHFVHSSV